MYLDVIIRITALYCIIFCYQILAHAQIRYADEFNSNGLRCALSVFESADGKIHAISCSPEQTYFLTLDTNDILRQDLSYSTDDADLRLARVFRVFDEDYEFIHALGNHYVKDSKDSTFAYYVRMNSETFEVIDTVALSGPISVNRESDIYGKTAWQMKAENRVEMVNTSIYNRDGGSNRAADIFGYDAPADSMYHVHIPFGTFYANGQYGISTNKYFHFQTFSDPMVRYDRLGNYEKSFSPLSLDNLDQGFGISGVNTTSFAYFDTSIYLFLPTLLFEKYPITGSVEITGSVMQIVRLSEDYRLLGRVFTDTLRGIPYGYKMGELNEGASATPDGKRLYGVSWDISELGDTTRWHIYRFAEGMQMLPTLEVLFINDAPGVEFTPDGILATRDGGAVAWGRNQFSHLRFYRISPDSAYVSSVIDLPWSERDPIAKIEPFAYPNPAGSDGLIRLDLTKVPEEARFAEAISMLGVSGSQVALVQGNASTTLQLPPAAGVYAIVLKDRNGLILARQLVVRP